MAGLNWLAKLLYGSGRDGADTMTVDRALSYAPVWYSVGRIAGHVARLPLNLHRINGKTNTKVTQHVGYKLLRVKPNAYQTPNIFKSQLMVDALLLGNGRAYYHRDGMNSELIPLMGDRCKSVLAGGEKVHFYKFNRDERLDLWSDIRAAIAKAKRDQVQPDVIMLDDADVLHIQGLGTDGVEGKSLIALAAQSWNIGLGAETQERKKQKKGYAGGLLLEAPPGELRAQKDAEEFLDYFRRTHDGENNAGKTGLLRSGVKAHVLAMSNTDAQFLEQRKFQRQDAALWFLLESILGDDASVSYNSLEQKNLAYLQNCLGNWLTKWEEECESKILTLAELEQGYYFKHNDGALLRADKATTATIVSTLISARVINANEAREMFEMNPYEGGDTFENPSVTPGVPGSSANKAMTDRVTHLLNVEGSQAIAACTAKNFVSKVETLYAKWIKTYTSTLGDALAVEHCATSKDQLLACADEANDLDQLKELVTKCVAEWPTRVQLLVQEMELAAC